MFQNVTLSAGVAVEFVEVADFLRITDTVLTDLSIIYYRNGAEIARADGVGEGYGEQFMAATFDRVRISSDTGGPVEFVLRLGSVVSYDKPPIGTSSIAATVPARSALTNTVKTVNLTSISLSVSNLLRQYLLIQNRHGSTTLWIRFGSQAATQATGIRLLPGESIEFGGGYCPTSAVTGLCDVTGNDQVIVVEG